MSSTELAFLRQPAPRGPSRPNTISAFDAACGAALRNARRRKGLRQLEIARHCAVIPANVSQWETGRSRIPPDHLPALAALLGVDIEELARPDHMARTKLERVLLARFRAASEDERRAALAAVCP